jgi:hypothetical protein
VAERSPSSVLLSHHAARSAGQDVARARQDGCRDELDPEAAILDQHRGDELLRGPNAWDAWDAVRPDAVEDVARPLLRALADGDAERSAARESDDRAPDARFLPQAHLPVKSVQQVAAEELYTPDAVQSEERSCAAQEAAAVPPDAVR